jgi:hypothetical protein
MTLIRLADVVSTPRTPSLPVLEPLIAAGLIARVRGDGRLTVYPEQGITPALDAHIRIHRDELIAALSVVHAHERQPLDWPPPEPAWFAAWMEADDRRRAETMAAGRRRLDELSRRQRR